MLTQVMLKPSSRRSGARQRGKEESSEVVQMPVFFAGPSCFAPSRHIGDIIIEPLVPPWSLPSRQQLHSQEKLNHRGLALPTVAVSGVPVPVSVLAPP